MKTHYYNLLNTYEKQVYDLIKQGIFTFQSQIAIPHSLARVVDVPRVYIFVGCDYPKVFYVNFYSYDHYSTATHHVIEPYYWYTASQIAKMDGKIDKLLCKMASRVQGNTQAQKVQSLYELVTNNVTYQREALVGDRHKLLNESNTIVGVLFYKKGLCEGIAKVFQMVANMLGIDCIVAHGWTENNSYHTWNIVQIDGATYHLDATYGIYDFAKSGKTCYDYLNLCDADVATTHKPSYPVPRCNATRHNYYVANNLVATNQSDVQRIAQNSTEKTIIFRYGGIYQNDVHAAAQECSNWIHHYHKRAKNVSYTYTPAYHICRVSYK